MGEWAYRSTYSWPLHWLEMSGQLHAPAALPLGKESLVPLDRRLGWPQSRSGRHGEEKILTLTGTRTPTPRSSSRRQSQYRLPYPGSQEYLILNIFTNSRNWDSSVSVVIRYDRCSIIGKGRRFFLWYYVGLLFILRCFYFVVYRGSNDKIIDNDELERMLKETITD
jgi:hypothetical protein